MEKGNLFSVATLGRGAKASGEPQVRLQGPVVRTEVRGQGHYIEAVLFMVWPCSPLCLVWASVSLS